MEDERVYTRALEVMQENFGHLVEMSIGTTANGLVAVRDVTAYYNDGKVYVLAKTTNTLMRNMTVCANVGLCHSVHNMQGVARSLGHPCDEQNAELRKMLKREFAMNYDDYVTESDPDMRIVEITLTKAEIFTRYHHYSLDFVNRVAERDHNVPLFLYR